MGTIFDSIADYTRRRVAWEKEHIPPMTMSLLARGKPAEGTPFLDMLRQPGASLICEVKKAAPGGVIISADFPYIKIAKAYESGGADAIACLTEPNWFKGSDKVFSEIRAATRLPMLRVDFIIDAYQIYQSKVMGADAVVLRCALLEDQLLEQYLDICRELGLAALVEAYDEDDVEAALALGAEIIAVNNRDPMTHRVELSTAIRLRESIPPEVLCVSESGVSTALDVDRLKSAGVDAILIGEALMRAGDPAALLASFKDAAR